ncbi:hypothetical protein FB451DRAFT_1392863 [Mycena latifolia]|nr:hypothetical protein FB451DRAFT_1392863 [Mycena latifolia]
MPPNSSASSATRKKHACSAAEPVAEAEAPRKNTRTPWHTRWRRQGSALRAHRLFASRAVDRVDRCPSGLACAALCLRLRPDSLPSAADGLPAETDTWRAPRDESTEDADAADAELHDSTPPPHHLLPVDPSFPLLPLTVLLTTPRPKHSISDQQARGGKCVPVKSEDEEVAEGRRRAQRRSLQTPGYERKLATDGAMHELRAARCTPCARYVWPAGVRDHMGPRCSFATTNSATCSFAN